jgi:ABC-type uncharacterized transport system auxiliary subunit
MIKNFFSLLALLLTLVCLLSSCADTTQHSEKADTEEIIPLHSIVVLPVQSVYSDLTAKTNKQLAAGADILDSLLQKYLQQKNTATEFHFISTQKMEALLGTMNGNIISQAKVIAQKLQSEGALIVNVSRFRERIGNNRSVSSPAAITFDYKLINSINGAILCSGVFEETQQALSENLFNFGKASRRGFKWITAEQLAQEGLADKFSECSYLAVMEE